MDHGAQVSKCEVSQVRVRVKESRSRSENPWRASRVTSEDSYKQLMDEVFVISRIIKVEVGLSAEAENWGW